ncbi:MAG: (2Fe-2S)-binding protein [Firmicutes bacterium]|nr:(2Fe-2S)-binding protein [Bacillota bacterium]
MIIQVKINGIDKEWDVDPGMILLDLLRDKGYKSIKRGCDEGYCGACTILLDGQAAKSCVMLAGQAHKRSITTVEGLGTMDEPHLLQKTFVEHGAVQCGYCIPGMLLSSKALLDENPNPTEDDVKEAIDGNLCRCTGYVKQIEAVLDTASIMRGEN